MTGNFSTDAMSRPKALLSEHSDGSDADSRQAIVWCVLLLIAALRLAVHLTVLATTEFGVHRDEFLYFAMGRHLHLWRMDFPPLIAMLANLSGWIFGDSLASVRVFPALEGATLIVLSALITRELGGGRFAQTFVAVTIATAPLFLRAATLFQPVVLDQLCWSLALFSFIRVLRHGGEQTWPLVGVALGLGLLAKFSIAIPALGIFVALILTPNRRMLGTRWPWIAAAIALVLGSPSLVGQLRLDFPMTSQMHELQATQLGHVTAWSFIAEQPLLIGIAAWPVALLGFLVLLVSKRFRSYRGVAVAIGVSLTLILAMHGKAYYAGPVYPTLIAAGAIVLEGLGPGRPAALLRRGLIVSTLLLGMIALPLAVPILSPKATAEYAARLGPQAAVSTNRGEVDKLPQDFADMLGWEGQAKALAGAFASLAPEEQREAVVIGGNYGEAGAAEFYRERYGMPPVVSVAGSFWYFGPGERPGRVAIAIGESPTELRQLYRDVRTHAKLESPWSVTEERSVDVVVARVPVTTLPVFWASHKGRQ